MSTPGKCSNVCLNVVTEQIGPMLGHLACYLKINAAEKYIIDLLFRSEEALKNQLQAWGREEKTIVCEFLKKYQIRAIYKFR